MTTFLTDNFTDTAGTAVTAHTSDSGHTWANNTQYSNVALIASGTSAVGGSSGTSAGLVSSVTPASADYSVTGVVKVFSVHAGDIVGLCARSSTTAKTFYKAIYTNGTGFQLFSTVANTSTQIGSTYTGVTLTAGQSATMVLTVQGTTISLAVNGSTVATGTDSAIATAGAVGILLTAGGSTGSTGAHLDSITANTLATPALVYTTQPANSASGSAIPTFVVKATTDGSTVDAAATGTVTISKASGSGTLSGTLTVSLASGVATFSAAVMTGSGAHTLTATHSVPSYTAANSNSFTVSGGANTAPTAAITAPADKSYSRNTQSLTFTGTGTDTEDGALTGASLVWTSDINGVLGTGTSLTKAGNTLTPGVHVITLTATDSGALTGTATITISVLKESVLSYTAYGVAGTWQQKISYFVPKGSPPAGGWPVKAYHGGSSSRSGSGNNDNDNTSWYEGGQFPSTILANPAGVDGKCIGIFMQAPSTSVDNPFLHFIGMWQAMIADVVSLYTVNQNRLYWLSWSQGGVYALPAMLLAAGSQRPNWAAMITAAGWVPPGFAALINTGLGSSNASSADKAAAANAAAVGIAQTPYKQYQSDSDANTVTSTQAVYLHTAETSLPNANYEYKDKTPADHSGTGFAMALDTAITITWLEAQQLAASASGALVRRRRR